MRSFEFLKEDTGNAFTAKVKDATYHRDEWNPDDPYADQYDYEDVELDIYYNGTRIGNLSTGVFGGLRGTVGKRGIDLDDMYEWRPRDNEDNIDQAAWETYVARLVTRYFTEWKTGQRHFQLISRQFGLDEPKEELEEIKVTKTVAGSRQPPSRKLAMKNKKKSPNQGKKAVELDKNPDAKDLANITLKGEYNQQTK